MIFNVDEFRARRATTIFFFSVRRFYKLESKKKKRGEWFDLLPNRNIDI